MFMIQVHLTMDTSIARFFLIFYYQFLFYSSIVISDTIVAPEWRFCQTIVQYYSTIIQYDITIVAPWRQLIMKILTRQYSILSQYAALLKVTWPESLLYVKCNTQTYWSIPGHKRSSMLFITFPPFNITFVCKIFHDILCSLSTFSTLIWYLKWGCFAPHWTK